MFRSIFTVAVRLANQKSWQIIAPSQKFFTSTTVPFIYNFCHRQRRFILEMLCIERFILRNAELIGNVQNMLVFWEWKLLIPTLRFQAWVGEINLIVIYFIMHASFFYYFQGLHDVQLTGTNEFMFNNLLLSIYGRSGSHAGLHFNTTCDLINNNFIFLPTIKKW